MEKRAAFAAQPYWGRPVPGWGDRRPGILIVGLAPAAHGGNRTGRVFTGDRSGDWLFAALHRVGLASQPTSDDAGDGLRLRGVRIVAPVRCAPPANRPTPGERETCSGWLDREVALVMPTVRAVVALGSFAWSAASGHARTQRRHRPQAAAEVRPRRRSRARRPRPERAAPGLLPPQSAEHVHRQAHRINARRRRAPRRREMTRAGSCRALTPPVRLRCRRRLRERPCASTHGAEGATAPGTSQAPGTAAGGDSGERVGRAMGATPPKGKAGPCR